MMRVVKKLLVFLLLFGLCQIIVSAQIVSSEEKKEIEDNIVRIEKEIARLQNKLKIETVQKARNNLFELIEGHQGRVKKLREELDKATGEVEDDAELNRIMEQIIKVEGEIERLEGIVRSTTAPGKIIQLKEIIDGHRARYTKLEEELVSLEAAAVKEAAPEAAATVEATIEVVPIEGAEPAQPEVIEGRFKFEVGGAAGLFGAATAMLGEVRMPLPFVFGPATTSLRFSGGLAQSKDMARRYAPIMCDGIFNFPAEIFTGVENYLGAGLNYVAYTSGQTQGTLGGQVFYGVESSGFSGRLFGEIGYGVLRTGFSPSHKGVTLLVGYRQDWRF
ncbi:MAG: hypothetical protein KKA31_04145 [Candidatus Margulisbacteria bacterium]|nr:hypothetical protein [Candidatus Margulisiibacteriota bacterium]